MSIFNLPLLKIFRFGIGAFIGCLLSLGLQAQEEDREVGLDTLAQRADRAYAESPEQAIPFLEEIRERLIEAEGTEFRQLLLETLFRLALIQMTAFTRDENPSNLIGAVESWDEFISRAVADHRLRQALLNRGNSLFILEEYDRAIPDYARLLEYPYSEQLSASEKLEVLERKALSLLRRERFDEANPLLRSLLELATDPRLRLFAMNGIIDHIIRLDDVEGMISLLPNLRRDRLFRFDLGINLRLLNFGDHLGEMERFAEAGLFYSAVVPVSEIIREVEARIIDIEEALFQSTYRPDERPRLVGEREELLDRRRRLAERVEVTGDLIWRQAIILQRTGRRFESFFAFRRLMEEHPFHERIEQFHYSAFLQAIGCDYIEDAIELGELYLLENHYLRFERFIFGQLGILYYRVGNIAELERVVTEFVRRFPEDPVSAQLVHQLGMAWFQREQSYRVMETFPDWMRLHPDGFFHDAALYWVGMAHLFDGDFLSALPQFQRIQEDFPGSVYRSESEFREAVCHFGIENHDLSRALFEAWVDTHPEHPLRPEAEVFLGDIAAIQARVDSALAHYEAVEEFGGSGRLIDHAYFEAAELLKANRRFNEHQTWLMRYMGEYGDRAAAPLAVLRMAEVDFLSGNPDEAFRRYRMGLNAFGNRRDNDAVDQILDQWWENYVEISTRIHVTRQLISRFLEDSALRKRLLSDRLFQISFFRDHPGVHEDLVDGFRPGRDLRAQLEQLHARTEDDLSIELRDVPSLGALLNRLEQKRIALPSTSPEIEFAEVMYEAFRQDRLTVAMRLLRVLVERGKAHVDSDDFTDADWEAASPGTAVWMAEQLSSERRDEISTRLFAVLNEFPESFAAERALLLLAQNAEQENLHDLSLERYQRLLREYGDGEFAMQASLGMARAYFNLEQFEEAITRFSDILQERNWRGPAWAEATLMIGRSFLAMGEKRKAQGFFERTYIAFAQMEPWVGQAHLESGRLLEMMGDTESARRTYETYIQQEKNKESPVYQQIRTRLNALPAPSPSSQSHET